MKVIYLTRIFGTLHYLDGFDDSMMSGGHINNQHVSN
jgi:hypothetical protein